MDPARLEDTVSRGVGLAALAVGRWYTLHRPDGTDSPVRTATARMRLPAHLRSLRADPFGRGAPVFEAVLDSAYVTPGDYLVGDDGTFFVATRLPLQPVLCVRAARLLSFTRPAPAPSVTTPGGYRGILRGTATPLLDRWPAAFVQGAGGLDRAGLPPDAPLGGWGALLPVSAGPVLRSGDLATDDLGRAGVISEAELSEHGWKLLIRQAAS